MRGKNDDRVGRDRRRRTGAHASVEVSVLAVVVLAVCLMMAASSQSVSRLMFLANAPTATVQAIFTPLANRKGRSFAGIYLGDSVRVRQILYNLVSNALKFTDAGEVRVTVGLRDSELSITVADTGIGIAAERQEQLFDKFVQADASTTRHFV